MGMQTAKIVYHLERAAIARADHAAGRPVSQGGIRYGSHLDRAAMHDKKAGDYLAAGFREYARRSQTRGARDQRKLRRRLAGLGPGRGKWAGSGWVTTGGRGSGWQRKTENS